MRYLKILILWLLLSLQACAQMTITPIMQGFTPSLVLDFTRGTLPVGLTFTRASIATRVNAQGLIETVAADQPRLDYDPTTLQARGILIEENRTNAIVNSTNITAGGWGTGGVTVTTGFAGPAGAGSAIKLTSSAVSNARLGVFQTRTLTAGQTYTFSVYLKAAEYSTATVFFNTGNTSPIGYRGSTALLNLATGVSSEPSYTSLTPAGNGWYRAVCTALIGGTGDQAVQLFITLGAPNGSSGDGASGIYMFGPQIELGSFATSYIPTTTSSVTRAAEMCTTPIGAWYNQNEGAALVEFSRQTIPSQTVGSSTFLNFTGTGSGINIESAGLGGPIQRLRVQAGGVQQFLLNAAPATPGIVYKMASAFRLNDFALTQNGIFVGAQTGLMPQNINSLIIGGSGVHIRRVVYYPKRVPNTYLQSLTQ